MKTPKNYYPYMEMAKEDSIEAVDYLTGQWLYGAKIVDAVKIQITWIHESDHPFGPTSEDSVY